MIATIATTIISSIKEKPLECFMIKFYLVN